ncbi:CTP:Inositol-1-phosphate cytidylyltransferase [Olavius sp. associated proteobacterium Delta 1]|nr:CTP:Inositol-1-phosphate cytidylyltransferase [Olavius sp. associated proteobacterium Delta 1]
MRAVILSAGQGKRLLPLTADSPKCILPIRGQTLIEWQIDELAKCGIEQATVVLGYRADKVERILRSRYGKHRVQTVYNAAYAVSDNLVSCWVAHDAMTEDFVLLNGDTLFEAAVLKRLLETRDRPVTVVVSQKSEYDADDMKVELDGCRLVKIGKDLIPDQVDGESIGMILFRDQGPMMFRDAIQKALRDPSSQTKWYLSVIDEMARRLPVWTCAVNGMQWCEVDYRADLKQAEKVVTACGALRQGELGEESCRVTEISMANP